jgi:hypothetical protein
MSASCASGYEVGAGKGINLVGVWCHGRGSTAISVAKDVGNCNLDLDEVFCCICSLCEQCFLMVLGVIFVEQLLVVGVPVLGLGRLTPALRRWLYVRIT